MGKTLCAQVRECVPWKTVGRLIERHKGEAGVRTRGCADRVRVMAFAPLTWRESLRDSEACLAAPHATLFPRGSAAPPARATLPEALNLRAWRISQALAQRLVARARALSAPAPTVREREASVEALDSPTLDRCLSWFAWAPVRSTKAAVKLHPLLALRSAIPAVLHLSDGTRHEGTVRDLLPVEAGACAVMDRGSVDVGRVDARPQAGACCGTRAKGGRAVRRVSSHAAARTRGVLCEQRVMRNGFYSAQNDPAPRRRMRVQEPESGQTRVFLPHTTSVPACTIAALSKRRWPGERCCTWIQPPLRIRVSWAPARTP